MVDFLLSGWTFVSTFFLALFVFGVTIFVHELGHFLVARRCGLVVKTFSIGFGHALLKWEKDGILYKVGWIPLGGYVSLPQLDPAGMERIQGNESQDILPEVSPWKKIAVAIAGPLGNILLACLLAVTIWLVPGCDTGIQIRPIIGTIETNSPAYAAGLRAGDEILSVNGAPIQNWYDFTVETLLQNSDVAVLNVSKDGGERELNIPLMKIENDLRTIEGAESVIPCLFGVISPNSPASRAGLKSGDVVLEFNGEPVFGWEQFTGLVQAVKPGEVVSLTIDRKGKALHVSISPEYNEEAGRMLIGVQLGGSGMPWMQYKNPLDQLKSDAFSIVRVFKALTNRKEAPQAAKSLGGPIAILDMLTMSIRDGLLNTLGLIRFLNVNLAVLNLMPIPVLDGGHILFALWCGITRRKVNVKFQTVLINLCAILLIGAMLMVTCNDIARKPAVKEFFNKHFSGQTESVQEVVPVGGE